MNITINAFMEDFIMKAKMKKISALFLSCILLFSITACQKKRTAKEVMQSSLKQSSSLKDADFNGNFDFQNNRLPENRNHQKNMIDAGFEVLEELLKPSYATPTEDEYYKKRKKR